MAVVAHQVTNSRQSATGQSVSEWSFVNTAMVDSRMRQAAYDVQLVTVRIAQIGPIISGAVALPPSWFALIGAAASHCLPVSSVDCFD